MTKVLYDGHKNWLHQCFTCYHNRGDKCTNGKSIHCGCDVSGGIGHCFFWASYSAPQHEAAKMKRRRKANNMLEFEMLENRQSW